ncbi:MAG TPA: LamG domain-containing protein [Thermoanaerobaculia bacterium]|nr:LamG domain-containing protein [Thermoanaerobaculia bacterium]
MSAKSVETSRRLGCAAGIALMLMLLGIGSPAQAQPFDAFLVLTGKPTHGFVRVPANAALNPAGNFTFEAWVAITNDPTGEDCRSIAGKNYLQAWWIGLCRVAGRPTLRSYLRGGASLRNGGEIEPNRWTHVAVVFNGTHRLHYINGELAASFAETGALTPSLSDMRIGSDVSWQFTPAGSIDEVRLWNVARTQAQIRAEMDNEITAAQAGLIGVWALDGNANDVIGPHDGSVQGAGIGFLTFPVAFSCGVSTASTLCLQDRFSITSRWRTNPAPGSITDGQSQVVGADSGSGIFWFFAPNNWEIMVKALNGCGLNNRFWIFSAATTNVFYRMEVLDVRGGAQRIYFNYPGPPAPAVTDVNAFATCP